MSYFISLFNRNIPMDLSRYYPYKIIETRRNKPDLECEGEHGKDVWRNGEQGGEGESTEGAVQVQIVLSRPWQTNTL